MSVYVSKYVSICFSCMHVCMSVSKYVFLLCFFEWIVCTNAYIICMYVRATTRKRSSCWRSYLIWVRTALLFILIYPSTYIHPSYMHCVMRRSQPCGSRPANVIGVGHCLQELETIFGREKIGAESIGNGRPQCIRSGLHTHAYTCQGLVGHCLVLL